MSLGKKSLNNFLADSLFVTLYERDDILHRFHLQFKIPIIQVCRLYVSEEQQ